MTKPFLFLDIDGVLNSFGGDNVWGDDEDHWLSPFGQGPFLVSISKSMASAINDLDCEIWWTTTWQTEAPLVGDLIGIKAEGVLDLDAQPGWKHAAVRRHLGADPRPFLWFEDDTTKHGTYNEIHRGHWPEHLVINPDPMTALTPDDLVAAKAFREELR